MSRRYRRKNNNALNIFFAIILILLIGMLCYRIYTEQIKPKDDKNKVETKEKDNKKTNENKNTDNKTDDSKTTKEVTTENANKVTNKPSQDEKTETKNENKRRGGNVTLELIGEENIIISQGSNYNDEGIKAYYSDGSDASVEVDVDNAVDTSKSGTYTVSYYAGNAVVIRRVTVE